MSMDLIKEYNNKLVDAMCNSKDVNVDTANLLSAIAMHMIEEHEQKETVFGLSPMVQILKDKILKESLLGNTVEDKQVYRNKENGTLCQVSGFNSHGDPYISFGGDVAGTITEFVNNYELVTMENIKVGEWVECVDTFNLLEGELTRFKKYKVLRVEDYNQLGLINDSGVGKFPYLKNRFKSCLPMEEETKEPIMMDAYEVYGMYTRNELFTQEQLDKAVKEAREEGKKKGYDEGYQEAEEMYEIEMENYNKMIEDYKSDFEKECSEGRKQGFKDATKKFAKLGIQILHDNM